MLVGSGLVVLILKLVGCEYYDDYEDNDGYHDSHYGGYVEESPDFGRVRRFGEVPGTPYPRNFDDIREALQKIMPGHTELFQDLFQPQITERTTIEINRDVRSLNQFDTSYSDQSDTPSHQSNNQSLNQFDNLPLRQYGVYEEITPETAPQNLVEAAETEAVMYRLTKEENTVTPWFMEQELMRATREKSTEIMRLTATTYEQETTPSAVAFRTDINGNKYKEKHRLLGGQIKLLRRNNGNLDPSNNSTNDIPNILRDPPTTITTTVEPPAAEDSITTTVAPLAAEDPTTTATIEPAIADEPTTVEPPAAEDLISTFEPTIAEDITSDEPLTATTYDPTALDNNTTTGIATTNTTIDSNTNTTNSSATAITTIRPIFDVELFLKMLDNITSAFETNNITAQMNMSLQLLAPTCGPTVKTHPPDYEINKDINNSVVAKCFVCGLIEEKIPVNSDCADAFAGDFLPLTPVNPLARSRTSSFRKYCRHGDFYNFKESKHRPRSFFGRWTGGCSVRWTDLTGLYTQRSCRNRKRATTGVHFASKRMAKLEMALGDDVSLSDVDYLEVWQGMVDARQLGLTRSFNVTNINQEQLDRLIKIIFIESVRNSFLRCAMDNITQHHYVSEKMFYF